MEDNSDLQKIQASEKPTSDDFEYAYVETVNKAFVRIAKERLKEILGANRYTNEEIDQKLSTIPKFNIEVVSSLPTTDISETTIYLVSSGDDSENLYTEYININGLWEILGTQKSTFSGSAKDVTYDDTETKLGATNVQDAFGQLSATVNDHKDNTNIHVTAEEKQAWNNKSNFSGSYKDLTDKPQIPEGADLTGYAKESFVKEYAQPKGEYLETSDLSNAVNTALAQAKESGEFDGKDGYTPQKGIDYFDGQNGKDGEDGKDGADGKTPVKGTDYFTEADRQEIVEDVLEQVEIPEGGTITDEQIEEAVNKYLDENPVSGGFETILDVTTTEEVKEIQCDVNLMDYARVFLVGAILPTGASVNQCGIILSKSNNGYDYVLTSNITENNTKYYFMEMVCFDGVLLLYKGGTADNYLNNAFANNEKKGFYNDTSLPNLRAKLMMNSYDVPMPIGSWFKIIGSKRG